MKVEEILSQVTGPPRVIPAIQLGSGISGIVKILVPGTGTPITTPIKIRKRITISASFRAQLKLSDHGPSDLKNFTINAVIATMAIVIMALCMRTKVVARSALHSHHVSGCRFLIGVISFSEEI
jgi:hypothetical protein